MITLHYNGLYTVKIIEHKLNGITNALLNKDHLLGRGTYGRVKLCTRTSDGKKYALKIISIEQLKRKKSFAGGGGGGTFGKKGKGRVSVWKFENTFAQGILCIF